MRLSPFSTFQSMRMEDPVPQFTTVITALRNIDIAYIHLVESRVSGYVENENAVETLDFALEAWGKQKPILLAGGFKPESAKQAVAEYSDYNIAIVFGRLFISTPDLVYRMRKGIKPNAYDRTTFYRPKERPLEPGYIDYPFSSEFLVEAAKN